MKANRAARGQLAGAEVVGAIILFGIFIATIALLNVTAVPNAGRAAEEEHYERTLSALNGLQSEAETAGLPGNTGSTVARSLDLAPTRSVGQDFFSFFLATPARASGELTFEPTYGNFSVSHTKSGAPKVFYDIGNDSERFPLGRISFDPHPNFRDPGTIELENAAIATTDGDSSAMRFDPPITVSIDGSTTLVAIKARVLAGTDFSIGGNAPVRTMLTTEAATLASPASPNAESVTLRISTEQGAAWEEFLARISEDAGLAEGTQYSVSLDLDADEGLDRVTWTVDGTGSGNDVALTTGLAVYGVSLS